jgi:hypothetical protein
LTQDIHSIAACLARVDAIDAELEASQAACLR